MWHRWRHELTRDPYYSPNLTLEDESGAADLTKPDGFFCMYAGTGGEASAVELGTDAVLGQQFFAPANDLCAVAVAIGPDAAPSAGVLRFHLRESPASTVDVRTVEVELADRPGGERMVFFDPIPDSAGRHWYFFLEHRAGPPVSLRRTLATSSAMGPCLENHVPTYGTLVFKLYGTQSYRCALTGW
jgi:hypothetical protein